MLRYLTSTLVACAFAGGVSILAQEQAPGQKPEPSAPPAQKEEAQSATLTGCVMEAKTTDGATAYVLDKAEGGKAPLYVLLGSTPTEMAAHVSKKVEVTGPVREPNAPPAGDAAAADPKVLRPPIVQVASVKVVAEDCK